MPQSPTPEPDVDPIDAVAKVVDDLLSEARGLASHADCVEFVTRLRYILGTLDKRGSELLVKLSELPTDSDRAEFFMLLGRLFRREFDETGSTQDLDRGIMLMTMAILEITVETDPSYISMPSHLSTIGEARLLFNESDPSYISQPAYLSTIGEACFKKFNVTRQVAMLDPAIMAWTMATSWFPNDYAVFNNLGVSLRCRFEQTGSIDDLNRAIWYCRHASELASEDLSNFAVCLDNFLSALAHCVRVNGETDELDRVVALGLQALKSSASSAPDLATVRGILTMAFIHRSQWTDSIEDLDSAIGLSEENLSPMLRDHPHVIRWLTNLGVALTRRFERTVLIEDLNRAIEFIEEALSMASIDDPGRASCLNNLSMGLMRRYVLDLRTSASASDSEVDLTRSISLLDEALKITPSDSPDVPAFLHNLSIALKYHFNRSPSLVGIAKVIATMQQAMALSTPGSPSLASRLNSLGEAFHMKYKLSSSVEDLELAIKAKEEAVAVDSAPPHYRIMAADSALSLLRERSTFDQNRAKLLLRRAIELLRFVTPRALNQRDRQRNVARFSGITARAVSTYLDTGGDVYTAIQLLETGRGLLASIQLDYRSDISVLKTRHPAVGQEFEVLRDQLDRPLDDDPLLAKDNSYADVEDTRYLSKRFDDLLATIRRLEGFDRFLLDISLFQLTSLAVHGPIVFFNVSEVRSDALLIDRTSIRSVQLPRLRSADLTLQTTNFLDATKVTGIKNYSNATRKFRNVLEWLWDAAVGPVLEALGFKRMPTEPRAWPRVWWVGCGLLNLLPIHAAGYYEIADPPQSAIDLVISSYTPTLKSLQYSRDRSARSPTSQLQKIALIGMSETPEHKDLPFVKTELEEIQKLLPQNIQVTLVEDCTKHNVLSTILDHQIAHFSCHGMSSAEDPSQSKLILKDWKSSPLTVSDLTSLNMISPQFAYLSACQTAATLDLDLLDESINLASAVQIAGYPSVVATLWQVTDQVAAKIAQDVYAFMLGRDGILKTQRAAAGLHWAVRHLREETTKGGGFSKGVDDPLIWASYIHVGE